MRQVNREMMKCKRWLYQFFAFIAICISALVILLYVNNQSLSVLWFYKRTGEVFKVKDFTVVFIEYAVIIMLLIVWFHFGIKRLVRLKWEFRFANKRYVYRNGQILREMNSKVLFVVIIICALISFMFYNKEIDGNLWRGSTTVGHSFGSIDGYSYTGCLEAFETNYVKGQRTFEIDMELTADNQVVLTHDWKYASSIQDKCFAEAIPSKKEFLATPIRGTYTPLSFEDMCALMEEYPDIWIITDSKYTDEDNIRQEFEYMRMVLENYKNSTVADRFIIQIYNEDMYDIVESIYHFKSYIFTMYQRWEGGISTFDELCRWCRERNIGVITIFAYLYNEEVQKLVDEYGIDLYLHTINDTAEAKAYLASGVRGIYTDDISPAELEED